MARPLRVEFAGAGQKLARIFANLSRVQSVTPLANLRIFVAPLMLVLSALPVTAKEFANIEYLCADWGPAMTLPSKPGEKPHFDDSQEEVYFLKQLGTFSRGLMGTGEHHGINIYLCKMKPDGSGKTEIRELWRNPNYSIDTQDKSTWMNVCVKTHQIALTVTFAGSDITGLWTMNLDGERFEADHYAGLCKWRITVRRQSGVDP